MRAIVRRLAAVLGYEIRRTERPGEPPSTGLAGGFQTYHYLRHNARRLEHLASLSIPVAGMTVLEVGAGIGDHTEYYLDRSCDITITEARSRNIEILLSRYPNEKVLHLDLEHPRPLGGAPFQVVHCYGLLYHLSSPEQALRFLSDNCLQLLFLETCVSFGRERVVNLVKENNADVTQALSGVGCRPTRPWLFDQLQRYFAYVYCPRTQPNHEEFPLDWTAPEKHSYSLQRSVFVASRVELDSAILSRNLLDTQTRHP
jgi:hypothetical protein